MYGASLRSCVGLARELGPMHLISTAAIVSLIVSVSSGTQTTSDVTSILKHVKDETRQRCGSLVGPA